MYTVNVSSISDFMQCRFRWWCRWVQNRVPVYESPALGGGKLLHLIFEDAARGESMARSVYRHLGEYKALSKVWAADSPELISAMKAVRIVEDLAEALPLWEDKFSVRRQLEVEEPFEFVHTEYSDILWRGRPDRVIVGDDDGRIWHVQNRGLAASTNFGTYMTLAKRHYHEHLYAEALAPKYREFKYGGTLFNLVRKLKYRTNVGKKNEATKTAAEMFFQMPMPVDLNSGLHKAVMHAAVQHVREMERVTSDWLVHGVIPPPNEKLNGGFSGNVIDPYFRVLIGEIDLDDPQWFKAREEMYASTEAEEA
jgi:hypothetical protein